MFTYIIYIICILIALLAVIPIGCQILMFIYSVPYAYWVGMQNCRGRYKELKDEGFCETFRHATALYISWILHKAPVFR